MSQFIAKSLGLPAMPLVIMEHPIAGIISENEIQEKAKTIVDQVIHVLTQSKELLEAEFKDKVYPLPANVCPMTRPGL